MRRKTKNDILQGLKACREALASTGWSGESWLPVRQQIEQVAALLPPEGAAAKQIFFGLLQALQTLPAEMDSATVEETRKLVDDLLQMAEAEIAPLPAKKFLVFLPYKAAMWDSLESIWRAAAADKEHCEAVVVPIPYADRDDDMGVRAWHCDADAFPPDVPVADWHDYRLKDLERLHPDAIFIHNPYDEMNRITSVDSDYYSTNLKKCTDDLIYVPYFVTGDHLAPEFARTRGIVNADHVIVENEAIKRQYEENYLLGTPPAGKFLALGSPKYDKVVGHTRDEYELPPAWAKLLAGKKSVLYNISVTTMLHETEHYVKKIRQVLATFRSRDDVVLWWRPHPLMAATFQFMRPAFYEEYKKVVEDYKEAGWGIYDDTPDLDRAIICTDAYYGDGSSLVALYRATGKPVIYQSYEEWQQKMFEAPYLDFLCSLSKDDALYFPGWSTKGFFRYDKKTKTTQLLALFPERVDRYLFHDVYKVGGKLYFLPTNAASIYVYSLAEKAWTTLPLDARYYIGSPYFRTTLQEGTRFWLFPYFANAILCLDTADDRLTYYDAWRADASTEDRIEFGYGEAYHGTVYFPVKHTDKVVAFHLKDQTHRIHHFPLEEEEYIDCVAAGACGIWCYTSQDRLICWEPEHGIRQVLPRLFGEFFGVAPIRCLGRLWLFQLKKDVCISLDEASGSFERIDHYAPPEVRDEIGYPSPRFCDGKILLYPNQSTCVFVFHPETGKADYDRIPNAPDYREQYIKAFVARRHYLDGEQNLPSNIAEYASWLKEADAGVPQEAQEMESYGEKIYRYLVK